MSRSTVQKESENPEMPIADEENSDVLSELVVYRILKNIFKAKTFHKKILVNALDR